MNEKVGRNDPCPCGSGKKYKNCHMLLEKETAAAKYTPSGKRKFKATVLSGSSAPSLFARSTPPQETVAASPTLEKFKFRTTTKDYRKSVEEEPLPFHIPTPEEPSQTPEEKERHLPAPDEEFKPTQQDFREKKE